MLIDEAFAFARRRRGEFWAVLIPLGQYTDPRAQPVLPIARNGRKTCPVSSSNECGLY